MDLIACISDYHPTPTGKQKCPVWWVKINQIVPKIIMLGTILESIFFKNLPKYLIQTYQRKMSNQKSWGTLDY